MRRPDAFVNEESRGDPAGAHGCCTHHGALCHMSASAHRSSFSSAGGGRIADRCPNGPEEVAVPDVRWHMDSDGPVPTGARAWLHPKELRTHVKRLAPHTRPLRATRIAKEDLPLHIGLIAYDQRFSNTEATT